MTAPLSRWTAGAFRTLARTARRLRRAYLRNLQVRLTLAVVSVAGIAVLAVTWVTHERATSALRTRIEEQLEGVADANVLTLKKWLTSQRLLLQYAAGSRVLASDAGLLRGPVDGAAFAEAKYRVAEDLRALRGGPLAASEVQLLSVAGGRVLVSTDPANEGRYAVDELFYSEGQKGTFTQNIYPSPVTARPTLTVASPVHDQGGQTIAVLAAHLDLKELDLLLSGRPGGLPIATYAVNRFSEYVTAAVFGRTGFARGIHSKGIDAALAHRNGAGEYTNYLGERVIGVWRWLPENELALLVESRVGDALAPARRLLVVSLLLSALALLTLVLGLTFITRRITRPVLATAAAAERVARGDFSARAPEGAEDEVGRLAHTFNVMARQLHSLYAELNTQVTTTDAALREAQASRALLQDVVDYASTMVCLVDNTGRIMLANRRFAATFAAGGDVPLHGMLADHIAEGAPDLLAAVDDARRSAKAVEREVVVSAYPESHTWLANCFPLRDGRGVAYAIGIIASDLTERARLEEERRHTDAKAQHAQKLESLGIMAGGIAHDFNNILGAVLGNADLALASLDEPAEVKQSLEQISAAARRAADLTRQMLAYAGKASFKREVLDLNTVVADIVALVRVAHSKKVQFEIVPSSEAAWVEADSAQLSQVVLNLVTNAAEAVGDGQGSVTVVVRSEAAPPHGSTALPGGHWRQIVVSDTGQGMDEATRRRIFEPFFTTKASGRGLGLSAVTGIVKSAGGVIEVDSIPGAGTTFDVYLAAAPAPADVRDGVVVAVDSPRHGTVLVVDDEETLRRVCRRGLERAGYQVLEAADGYEGINAFLKHAHRIDAIVLDLTMPGMGGAEVLLQVRRESHTVPVIIASGYDAVDSAAHLPSDGHVRFLQKPFALEALVALVTEVSGFQSPVSSAAQAGTGNWKPGTGN